MAGSRSTAPAGSEPQLSENVEQLRARLETMKRLMAETEARQQAQSRSNSSTLEGGLIGNKGPNKKNADSIIDGSFLSFVFAVVLILIICVSIYAFQNLYYAILKKFPSRPHTEL